MKEFNNTMKISFQLTSEVKILEFYLINYERIEQLNIFHEVFARTVLRNANCQLSKDKLQSLLKYYMGGNGTLKEYISHIEKYGFYSPYQPNLRIIIQPLLSLEADESEDTCKSSSEMASMEELKQEAIRRLGLLKVPQKIIQSFEISDTPTVTYFNAETGCLKKIHEDVLRTMKNAFSESTPYIPFYITESWHVVDVISVLYVTAKQDNWEWERADAEKGYHSVFAYSPNIEIGELGSGFFSIEDGVLWRCA